MADEEEDFEQPDSGDDRIALLESRIDQMQAVIDQLQSQQDEEDDTPLSNASDDALTDDRTQQATYPQDDPLPELAHRVEILEGTEASDFVSAQDVAREVVEHRLKLARISDLVTSLMAGEQTNRRFRVLPVKKGSTAKQFLEETCDNNTLVTLPSGGDRRECTNDSQTSAIITPTANTEFVLEMTDLTTNCTRYILMTGGGAGSVGFEVVFLAQNGGSAGTDQSASCTYTYDVKRYSDHSVVYGTTVAVLVKTRFRSLKVQCTAGTTGLAVLDTSTEPPTVTKLVTVFDEYPANENDCTVPGGDAPGFGF